MDEGEICVRVAFEGLTRAEASRAVHDLRQALHDRGGEDVRAEIAKDDPDSQDDGTVLILWFAGSAATAVAAGIRAYAARWADQRDRITITTADGTTIVATGEPARRLEAAALLRAAVPVSPARPDRVDAPPGEAFAHGAPAVILFLAANPVDADRLALDREARAITVELERSGYRDDFELVTRWAVQPLDLLRELRKLRPTVVHFSGHGRAGAPRAPGAGEAGRRDFGGASEAGDLGGDPGRQRAPEGDGLYFQAPDGRAQRVSSAALGDAFGAAGASVRLVVLNACHSDAQARALLAHVDCVVGMRGAIGDDAARAFAIGFYGGLGERASVAAACQHGRAAIQLEGLRDEDRPRLQVRDGVDASRLFLTRHTR